MEQEEGDSTLFTLKRYLLGIHIFRDFKIQITQITHMEFWQDFIKMLISSRMDNRYHMVLEVHYAMIMVSD